MEQCPCGSFLAKESCCLPIVSGTRAARTALELMRSRYSAYVWGNAQYIFDTYAKEWREKQDEEGWLASFQQIQWESLEIVSIFQGATKDQTGEVEFAAHYRMRGQFLTLHERSFFHREGERWVYVGEANGQY